MSTWARPDSIQQLQLCFCSSSSCNSRGRQSRRVSLLGSAQIRGPGAISKKLKKMTMMMRLSVGDASRIDGRDEDDDQRGMRKSMAVSLQAAKADRFGADQKTLNRAADDKYNYSNCIGQSSEHDDRSVDENDQYDVHQEADEKMRRMRRTRLSMQCSADDQSIIAGDGHVGIDDYDDGSSDSGGLVLMRGRLVEGGGEAGERRQIFRQAFPIRWYDVNAFDSAASINTIALLLQETSFNHMNILELTRNDTKRRQGGMRSNLIWVVTRLHIKMTKYPRWGNTIEIDSWLNSLGANGIRRDFLVRDHHSKRFLGCATSNWVLMNGESHKLSKIPQSTRDNISSYCLDRRIIQVDPFGMIPIIKDPTCFIKQGLVPKIYDFDLNQHVNPTKYVGWILESVPDSVIESSILESITLEWRRECHPCDIMDSITSFPPKFLDMLMQDTPLKFTHTLRLQNVGLELVRAKTQWQTRR